MRRGYATGLVGVVALCLLSCVFGLPIVKENGRGERNTFHVRPTWTTVGVVPPTGLNESQSYSIALEDGDKHVEAIRTEEELELSKTTGRQTKYVGNGNKSKWEIHVFNEPSNINVAQVMNRCIQIIEGAWVSEVLVLMRVVFVDIEDPNTLARGGGSYFVKMPDVFGEVVIPVAAAEAIRKRDLNGDQQGEGRYDVLVTINSRSPWYDGVDGNVQPEQYDLITVLLHEIYHNIVFAGSIMADVKRDVNAPGGVRQVAYLHKGYRTRYDMFLANKDNCAVLGYLDENHMASTLGITTGELLANACANDNLYFSYWYQNRIERVTKLYAPRVYKKKSSVYHLDYSVGEGSSLMFPTITRGTRQHTISAVIIRIQQVIINTDKPGAYTKCNRPLWNPIHPTNATDGDFQEPEEPVTPFDGEEPTGPRGVHEDDVKEVGGLPTWAFALLIVFAILLALLLLGLCLALLLRRKRRRAYATVSRTKTTTSLPKTVDSRTATGTGTGTGTRKSLTEYIPGVGGKTSRTRSSRSRSRSSSVSRSRSESESRSRKTSSKKETTVVETESMKESEKKSVTCPSTGKRVYKCKCYCCCPEKTVKRPEPVASVHTFDPESIPGRRRSSSQKSLKKCKSKTEKICHRGCHCYYCCRYKPSSSKSSSKCTRTTSDNCKTTTDSCKTTTKCTTTTCYCKSSSSSKCDTRCKSTTTKTKCTSSRAPPSTKPPTTKVCRPPTTKPSSCKPAAASSSRCYRTTGRKCSCNKCARVVEININNRC